MQAAEAGCWHTVVGSVGVWCTHAALHPLDQGAQLLALRRGQRLVGDVDYESARRCRIVFALWRQWTCCRLLREQGMVAEARHASLYVSPAPWWEAGGDAA